MPSTKVVDILDRASIILQDDTHVRFPQAELLKFFNDAQLEIVLHRPDANIVNATLSLADGSKQTIPSAALRLVDVVRNTDGRAITQVSRQILDETLPTWHEKLASSNKIEHYIYDPADPKTFYVYPKAELGVHSLEILYSAVTATITISDYSTDTTVIGIDDIYANAVLDYMLYRAYQKDSEFAGNLQKAMMHYSSFSNAIGIKSQADGALTPTPEQGVIR